MLIFQWANINPVIFLGSLGSIQFICVTSLDPTGLINHTNHISTLTGTLFILLGGEKQLG